MRRIVVLLASSPDPDQALRGLTDLAERQPAAFHRLARSKAGLPLVMAVFACSRFLGEQTLQRPEWLEALPASGDLHRMIPAEDLIERLEAYLGGMPGPPSPLKLASFRRQQLLRILLRDVQGLADLSEISEELSNLADAMLHVVCRRLREDLIVRYGTPRYTDASGQVQPCEFSVLALGKLGGKELNYSSDIDLMFVYSAAGDTDGPSPISNKQFFQKVATHLTELLSEHTAEGISYRVDLRLRPDGRLGEVAISLEGAKTYYRHRGRDWELQMLIKARVAAGEPGPGRELLAFVEPLTYSTTLDFSAVESVSVARLRIHEKLAARRGQSGLDVKLARGGIRDIEFLVQCLQRLHGGREAWVRQGGTLLALFRLRDKDFLSPIEYSRLASAYQFLRNLEHRLQFAEDRQTHTLPSDREEQELLARRMPAAQLGSAPSAENLLKELNTHLEEVQEIYERVIHAQQPLYYTNLASTAAPDGARREDAEAAGEPAVSSLVRSLDQRAPGLAATLARGNLRRGARHFEHFLELVRARPEYLERLDRDPILAAQTIDLFEHSPFFAEQLIRTPELLEELIEMRERPEREPRYEELSFADPGELRRYFRRRMMRIQSESICLQLPIFTTLGRTSDLADAVTAACYRLAVEQVAASRPPAAAGYRPQDQLMAVALGRLGQREFDLASDADLVFVLPDSEVHERVFWTRVAEKMIDLITAYTGDGVLFAVDTRLRPNGREGALVQTEAAFKDYFAHHAQAWEGIAYMKSRAVAGDLERATKFLDDLQQIDWRRYGQSYRSKKALKQMRQRLEKEQGSGDPLKAGFGGFYDIDFALMYLRLKAAGMFFKVLNTPQRIDVIERMGHLERADAVFLNDAAIFYRAVDHALRVSTGHAEGSLPASHSQLALLTGLVVRWTPEHLHDQPLDVELAQIRSRTREYFDRLFG
ncbi:MAG: glutamine-synthetase adenylyltransferase [Acidobacteria bacterium]|nr:glutamine-synthetase adenylyltransferase [Acidobacteriota bacterium]